MKSANDDTDEEESSRTYKGKKNDRTITNMTHLNTSSHVLMDKNSKTVNKRSQYTLKSL